MESLHDQDIDIHKLKKPEGDWLKYRVRPINERRVSELKSKMTSDTFLNSQITVVKEVTEDVDVFVILDGNHRFHAMTEIRQSLQESNDSPVDLPFKTVGCRVVQNMPVMDCVALATSRNLIEGDRLQMTDYEVTAVIRNVIDGDPTVTDPTELYEKIYKLFKCSDVST